ncbi:MAG TPA: P-II family nitrogen regulator [Candidatus Merdenecus merdavium]|nr:P-II family nitrogen regulator [Candidatus Merdenecus merdavium]
MVLDLSKGAALVLMITIVDRGTGDKVVELLKAEGAEVNLLTYARGTASSEIMEYLGLADTEREIVFTPIGLGTSKKVIKKIRERFRLEKPGKGIIFTIPISSICGKLSAKLLYETDQGDEISMEKTDFELIIVITTRGYADDVMSAARGAKATGGTVIHARGMGHKAAEKFFGITVQPEKELLFILTQNNIKKDIMKAIVSKYGMNTEAKSVVFSLPVSDVDGLPEGFRQQEIKD